MLRDCGLEGIKSKTALIPVKENQITRAIKRTYKGYQSIYGLTSKKYKNYH